MSSNLKLGDFTQMAKYYKNRPTYSLEALKLISGYIENSMNQSIEKVADIGAGTGKLTENLSQLGFSGLAVEPNDAMREEGMKNELCERFSFQKGAAEETGLDENFAQWVLMGSSFHWTQHKDALKEFHRILTPGGFFTAIWNPRDIEKSPLHTTIESKIHEIAPNIVRVSSGSSNNLKDVEEKLLSTNYFSDLFFVEVPFELEMSKQRYIDTWKSVNDIQVQAGEEKFKEILAMIETEISGMDSVLVPYKARAWTVRSTK
ncbi:MAG: class I SAM-dependent methyltransferase [Eubacteriales bacterium]